MMAMNAETMRPKTPLCVYVLWHPRCDDGEALARTIYDWFHAPTAELHRAGLGLPVYYRSRRSSIPVTGSR